MRFVKLGRSVLDMATRITTVSGQAQESATVARQSLLAAEQRSAGRAKHDRRYEFHP